MPDGKLKKGFACMDPERVREIARLGGQAAHLMGVGHEFTPEEATEAGRKGGKVTSQNREHMAEIGRKGGRSKKAARQLKPQEGIPGTTEGEISPNH